MVYSLSDKIFLYLYIIAKLKIITSGGKVASAKRPNFRKIEEQYGVYDYYQPQLMKVVPPGTDLEQFKPPDNTEYQQSIYSQLCRFFLNPDKPIILVVKIAK